MCFRSPCSELIFLAAFLQNRLFPKHTSGHASSLLKFCLWRPTAYGIKARPSIICLLPGLPGPPVWPGWDMFLPNPAGLQGCASTGMHTLSCRPEGRAVPTLGLPHRPCSKATGWPPCVLFYSSVPTSCNYLFPLPLPATQPSWEQFQALGFSKIPTL